MNYEKYRFTKGELFKYTSIYLGIILAFSYLFYDSFIPLFIFVPFIHIFFKRIEKTMCIKRRETLKTQFCEMISSLSTVISAGISVDNAFIETLEDMRKLYGEESLIVKELTYICESMKINRSIDSTLFDFADRSGDEDIKDFFDIFCEARISGGNLTDIIKKTVSNIKEKKDIEDEITAMLEGKKLEQKVMSGVPIIIIVFLKLSSSDFISGLYHNIFGYVVMSICLVLYIIAYLLSEKIANIKV